MARGQHLQFLFSPNMVFISSSVSSKSNTCKNRKTLFYYDHLDVKVIRNVHAVWTVYSTLHTVFYTHCVSNKWLLTIIMLIIIMNDNSYHSALAAGTWKLSWMREGVTDLGIITRFLCTWNRIRTFKENVERTTTTEVINILNTQLNNSILFNLYST